MITEGVNESLSRLQEHDSGSAAKSRAPILVGIGLSVLLHAIGLYLFVTQSPDLKATVSGGEARITVSLALPPIARAPEQKNIPAPAVEAPEKISPPHPPRPVQKKRHKKTPADRAPHELAKNLPEAIQPKAPKATRPDTSLPDDMFTQLEEKRRRRAEANARPPEPEAASPANDRAQNDNSVALANIARSLKHARGNDRVDAGGVFEMRNVRYYDAEVVFWGWSANSRRNSMRLIEVEKGSNPDIQTAIVNKIIDVIREDKSGDFVWDSHRLGRQITLSARPRDTAELRRFLMKEFFPDYLPATPGR